MSQRITIDPVTRIEGHAKITIDLDDNGLVENAHFHVTQLRGFEKLCEGRPFYEMPALMARICGICPVSHLMASAKACDELLAVRIPPTAVKLRKIMNLAQMIQSHALSFFYLSSPDLLLGMDGDPAKRNIFGVAEQYPELALGGVKLRKFGQTIIEMLGGQRIHPAWVVPGGVSAPLTEETREEMLAMIPEAKQILVDTLQWFKSIVNNYRDEIRTFANFPTMFMGMVTPSNSLEFYEGALKLIDAEGAVINPAIDVQNYGKYIGEAVEPWSYLKSPYYRPTGHEAGIYRVGPLARLNIVDSAGTPIADDELAEFRELDQAERNSSFHYHWARLVEMLFGFEQIEAYLNDEDILNPHVRAVAEPNQYEGVGVSEAPRGTLLHHYKIDENGLMVFANLIIATGNNNRAMDQGVLQVAKEYVRGGDSLEEGMLNRVEAVIRTFDPCLSCSTHAIGKMPIHIQLRDAGGQVLDDVKRD